MTMRFELKFYPTTEQEVELALPVLAKLKAVVDQRAGFVSFFDAIDTHEADNPGSDGTMCARRVVKLDGWTRFNETAPPMCFGSALAALKSGKKVARAGWNGKGMYLGLCEGGGFRDGCRTQDFVYMKTAQDTIVPWLASQTDMLAEDWLIIE